MTVIKINTPAPKIIRVRGIAGGPEGPPGPTGAPGAAGPPGADGASWNTALGVSYTSNQTAVIADADKVVTLNGASSPVTYSINPSTFLNKRWTVRCSSNTNLVQIYATTGFIEDLGGDNVATIELLKRQVLVLYSNGTNIWILSST